MKNCYPITVEKQYTANYMKKLDGLFSVTGTVSFLSLHCRRGLQLHLHPLFSVVHKLDTRCFWVSPLYVLMTGRTTPQMQTVFYSSFQYHCILISPSHHLIHDYINLLCYTRKNIDLLYTVCYSHTFIISIFFSQDA